MSKKKEKNTQETNIQKENEEKNEQSRQESEQSTQENQSDKELKKCQEELNQYKDKYLRAYADFENTKKRLEKEKTTAVMYAHEAFAKDLLPVLDTFENALKAIDALEIKDEAVEKIKEGMVLTYEKLLNTLKKHGIEEVECEGEFDPNYHQVVMEVESDKHKKGEIVQVLQKGYKIKDRLLRAAMVSSCK